MTPLARNPLAAEVGFIAVRWLARNGEHAAAQQVQELVTWFWAPPPSDDAVAAYEARRRARLAGLLSAHHPAPHGGEARMGDLARIPETPKGVFPAIPDGRGNIAVSLPNM